MTGGHPAAVGPTKSHWLTAAQLGLVSSTISTIVSQLAAARIGRDAAVDWMTVAAIPFGNDVLTSQPSSFAIVAGIAFHQWADFSWAMVFFGLLGRWTAGLKPVLLLCLALPWAVFTSATEWLVLVPLFPFWQPLFTLQQPYWIGLLVHLSSALAYPLYPWLRWRLGHAPQTRDVRTSKRWAFGWLTVITVLSGIALSSVFGRELPWLGANEAVDRAYIRHMTTHHEQGIQLANLGVARGQDPDLRSLAALMVASQTGENKIFKDWWTGWFNDPLAICSAEERRAMPGLLDQGQVDSLTTASSEAFDTLFIALMSIHHAGAVKMADAAWRGRGDPRLRIMAHAIRHAQQGQIALMHRVTGATAVSKAIRNMLADTTN